MRILGVVWSKNLKQVCRHGKEDDNMDIDKIGESVTENISILGRVYVIA
jgi:hypothetical protein